MAPPRRPNSHHCKICEADFHNFDAFHQHKLRSKVHNTCYACSRDFVTLEGLDRHCKQDHAHAQNLPCAMCRQVFTTLGGLTSHIEAGDCASTSDFHLEVKQRTVCQHSMTAARNHVDTRSANTLTSEPMPALRDFSKANVSTANVKPESSIDLPGWGASAEWGAPADDPDVGKEGADTVPSPAIVESDLMIFDEILNSDWHAGAKFKAEKSKENFAALMSYKNPTLSLNLMNTSANTLTAWSKKPSTVPNIAGPIAKAPVHTSTADNTQILTEVFAATNLAEDPPMSPWDPDNPMFRIFHYYLPATRQYRCPHPGCRKNLRSDHAFIQHLQSSAHRNEKLQCHGCLRYFESATALAQHASAQGVRCKIRDTDEYEKEVDRFTAGYVTTNGRWDDDTIRYAAISLVQTAQGLVDSHNANLAEKDEQKEEFWCNNTPAW